MAQFSRRSITARNLNPRPEGLKQVVFSSCLLVLHGACQTANFRIGRLGWHAVPAGIMKNLRTATGGKSMIPWSRLWLSACISHTVQTTPGVVMTREQYGDIYQTGRERTIRFLLSRGAAPGLAPDIAQSAWLRGWERL